MEGAYILVVDDESRMRKLLKDFLSAKGYKKDDKLYELPIHQYPQIFHNL